MIELSAAASDELREVLRLGLVGHDDVSTLLPRGSKLDVQSSSFSFSDEHDDPIVPCILALLKMSSKFLDDLFPDVVVRSVIELIETEHHQDCHVRIQLR